MGLKLSSIIDYVYSNMYLLIITSLFSYYSLDEFVWSWKKHLLVSWKSKLFSKEIIVFMTNEQLLLAKKVFFLWILKIFLSYQFVPVIRRFKLTLTFFKEDALEIKISAISTEMIKMSPPCKIVRISPIELWLVLHFLYGLNNNVD